MVSTLNGKDVRLERALEQLRHWTLMRVEANRAGRLDDAVAAQRRIDECTLSIFDLRAKGARPLGGENLSRVAAGGGGFAG